jgi:hypothetical protein
MGPFRFMKSFGKASEAKAFSYPIWRVFFQTRTGHESGGLRGIESALACLFL